MKNGAQNGGVLESVRALLSRIIDYAGLFPPAALDMAATVRNYAGYLQGADSWMLGRLIVPVSRLSEFEEHAAQLLPRGSNPNTDPWQISALTAPAGSPELADDLARIEAFNARHAEAEAGAAVIDTIELRAGSSADIDRAVEQLPDNLFAFFELPIEPDPRGLIAALADGSAGAKVRTGGATAEFYPKPEALGRFIFACAAANVPFKATAGLHHPLRRKASTMGSMEFGFLNVFMAGCAARIHRLDATELVDVLTEESNLAFTFDHESVTWRKHRMTVEDVADAREEFAVSFGSCSFDEPREDLRGMKLL